MRRVQNVALGVFCFAILLAGNPALAETGHTVSSAPENTGRPPAENTGQRPLAPLTIDPRATLDPNLVFKKYSENYEKLVAKLDRVTHSIANLYAAKKNSPEPLVAVGLVSEYRRLLAEKGQVEGLRNGTLDRKTYLQLMVENLVVGRLLDMLATYAGDLTKLALKRAEKGKTLTAVEMIARAAKQFPGSFNKDQATYDVFKDKPVIDQSIFGKPFTTIANNLFEPNSNDVIMGRVTFFRNYANQLARKNAADLAQFQTQLDQARSALEQRLKKNATPPAPAPNQAANHRS